MSESTIEIKSSNYVFEEKRGRTAAPNPFVFPINDSWKFKEEGAKLGKTLQVTVPAGAVATTTVGQIRKAAADQGLGVRIETVLTDKAGRPRENGNYATIYFAAKKRTVRARKDAETTES